MGFDRQPSGKDSSCTKFVAGDLECRAVGAE
jgi:hypothetical protein